MRHLLITGASGLLGANLLLEGVDAGYRVSAVCNQHPLQLVGAEVFCCDLAAPGVAMELLQRVRPDAVIHCAAATNVDVCEDDREMAFRLNRDMAAAVAQAGRSVGAHVIHISTDAVFDGEKGNYAEEDPPRPINVYAESKLAGEQAVRRADPSAAIIRTNLFGWNAQNKLSLSEWFLNRLQSDDPVPGFHDVWFSPILVNDLAHVLFMVAERQLEGLYHIGGRDCLSKYAFGQAIAAVFGLQPACLQSVSVDDVALRAQRSKRLCLQVGRIQKAVDETMPAVHAGLRRMAELQGRYRTRLKDMLVQA